MRISKRHVTKMVLPNYHDRIVYVSSHRINWLTSLGVLPDHSSGVRLGLGQMTKLINVNEQPHVTSCKMLNIHFSAVFVYRT